MSKGQWGGIATFVIIAFLLVVFMPSGCVPPETATTTGADRTLWTDAGMEKIYPNTHRFVDEEYGVVCYVMTTNFGIGISCLPLESLP